jgi:hypothetical protein
VGGLLALAACRHGGPAGRLTLEVRPAGTVTRGTAVTVVLRNGTAHPVTTDLSFSLYAVRGGTPTEIPALGPGEVWPLPRITVAPHGVSPRMAVSTARLAPGTYRVGKPVSGATPTADFTVTA